MKKTVTTMLSLVLALILVSSLSSGVALAKGDDDHDNREKNKNKFHTEHDVGIMTCSDEGTGIPGLGPMFVGFDSNVDDILLPGDDIVLPEDASCAVNLAFLRNDEGFKIQKVNSNFFFDVIFSSYILERNRRVRN